MSVTPNIVQSNSNQSSEIKNRITVQGGRLLTSPNKKMKGISKLHKRIDSIGLYRNARATPCTLGTCLLLIVALHGGSLARLLWGDPLGLLRLVARKEALIGCSSLVHHPRAVTSRGCGCLSHRQDELRWAGWCGPAGDAAIQRAVGGKVVAQLAGEAELCRQRQTHL